MRAFWHSKLALSKAGFSLVEMAIVLAVAGVVITSILQLTTNAGRQAQDSAMAAQHMMVHRAAEAYIQAQYTVLVATAGFTTAAPIVLDAAQTTAALQNYLPPGFTYTNVQGQDYRIAIRRQDNTTDTRIDVLVYTVNGTGFGIPEDQRLGSMITQMGAAGGAMFANPALRCAADSISGAFSGYCVASLQFGVAAATISGRLVSVGFYSPDLGFSSQRYLHRLDEVSDNPAQTLNTMETTLLFTGVNGITMAGGPILTNGGTISTLAGNIDMQSNSAADGRIINAGTVASRALDVSGNAIINGALTMANGGIVNTGDIATNGGNINMAAGTITGGDGTFTGTLQATSFVYTSDGRLKENIEDINSPLARLLTIKGVSYIWKDGQRPDMGVIAQDVAKAFPELVRAIDTNGTLGVEIGNLIAPVIEAIRELSQQNAELRHMVQQQAADIATLRDERAN